MKIILELATFSRIQFVLCVRYQLVSPVSPVVVERHVAEGGGGGVVV